MMLHLFKDLVYMSTIEPFDCITKDQSKSALRLENPKKIFDFLQSDGFDSHVSVLIQSDASDSMRKRAFAIQNSRSIPKEEGGFIRVMS